MKIMIPVSEADIGINRRINNSKFSNINMPVIINPRVALYGGKHVMLQIQLLYTVALFVGILRI